MAQPSPAQQPPTEMPLRDARVRLPSLARMTRLTGGVTVITDNGEPLAALVPVEAARTQAEARAAETRREAAARGWQARLESMRDDLRRQHDHRTAELQRALAAAWTLIDQHSPPGTDRHTDDLRAQHRPLTTN